ncbi:fibrocystin-L-like isoform X1 [Brachionus plicatilis]|uniref:Fibrocystin-L-like isoform X1 n=1 Tax=Brachionus plicatilis TaxID=10195 RepID=A0A3M7P8F2_BRAPC|nr:fibrocystin-L-like isoform X1 [Brachionus plicatilis]
MVVIEFQVVKTHMSHFYNKKKLFQYFFKEHSLSLRNLVDYSNVTSKTGAAEVQKITLNSSFNVPYILSFENVETVLFDFETTSALNIQNALNDLPSLGSNLVSVSQVSSSSPNIKIFRVTFSADLGNVPDLEEKSGNLVMEVEEETRGVASGSNVQLTVQGQHSPLFSLTQTSDNIKAALKKTFGIRCPVSIQEKTEDVHDVYDFETCWSIPEGNLNDNAFCGQCSSRSSSLFYQVNAFSSFKYLCFAYKQNIAFYRIDIQFRDYGGSYHYRSLLVDSIPDNQWHYACFDIVTNLADNIGSFLIHRVKIFYKINQNKTKLIELQKYSKNFSSLKKN